MPDTSTPADDLDLDLATLGHRNYIEFTKDLTRAAGDRGEIVEADGLLLCSGGTTFPALFNAVWRLDPAVPGEEALARADRWFAERGRGYTVNVRDGFAEDDDLRAAADARGLLPVLTPPEMVCRRRLDDVPLADGIELRWIEDQSTLDDFVAVSDAAYQSLGMTAGAIAEAVTDLSAFTAPHVHSVVAYDSGEPIAAAQTVLSHGIAGVYWVGTLEAARGKGMGEAVTRAVTNRAFDEGAAANTLQASPMGEAIYARMGYETVYHYTGFVRFEPAAA